MLLPFIDKVTSMAHNSSSTYTNDEKEASMMNAHLYRQGMFLGS